MNGGMGEVSSLLASLQSGDVVGEHWGSYFCLQIRYRDWLVFSFFRSIVLLSLATYLLPDPQSRLATKGCAMADIFFLAFSYPICLNTWHYCPHCFIILVFYYCHNKSLKTSILKHHKFIIFGHLRQKSPTCLTKLKSRCVIRSVFASQTLGKNAFCVHWSLTDQ